MACRRFAERKERHDRHSLPSVAPGASRIDSGKVRVAWRAGPSSAAVSIPGTILICGYTGSGRSACSGGISACRLKSGRLPSLLGREFFRTRVTSYHAGTFEDAVIFVHDVARGLAQLGAFEHKLIAKIALQDYTQNETARVLGCWRRTVGRRFPEALDQMTDIFLAAGLLIRLPATDVARAENCQEGEIEEIAVSASEHGE